MDDKPDSAHVYNWMIEALQRLDERGDDAENKIQRLRGALNEESNDMTTIVRLLQGQIDSILLAVKVGFALVAAAIAVVVTVHL